LGYGQPLHYFEETTSTNDEALAAARRGSPHGALFVAGRQSQGRGRRGRQWFSDPRESLTFSLLTRPRIRQENAAAISLVVGLAVHDALAPYIDAERALGIKWPNDIVFERKKLAGILIEMSQTTDPSAEPAIVVGIGINLATRDFPVELRDLATSLALLTDRPPKTRETLLVELLTALERRIESFSVHGLGPSLKDLEARDALRGHRILVEDVVGVARGISERGELILEQAGGSSRIASGTVLYAD
jgi:BirA family biotin operon repressor/biotin-[acetyl-CoA-carboxylase] ligase